MKRYLFAFIAISLCVFSASAQELRDSTNQTPGLKKFFMPGAAVAMFQVNNTKGAPTTSTFMPVNLALFPLVKASDRLFLDAGLNFSVNPDGTVTPSLIELIAYYRITTWMSAFAGNFSPHYGVYLGILDDFTNRFGTGVAPVGMGHGLQNQNGIGIQGGVQTGYSKISYQLYVANGPQLTVDTATVGSANQSGTLSYGNIIDNNKSKSIGWHIGYLPFSNSCLEVTFSGEYAGKTGAVNTQYENVSALSWAAGLNYYHMFNPIMVRVIAEYDKIQVGNANYYNPDPTVTNHIYTFSNMQNGWFAGATIKPSGSRRQFIKSLELAGRIGAYNPPSGALWGSNPINQTTVTLTEYVKWDIPISLEYDILTQNGAPTQNILSAIVFFRF